MPHAERRSFEHDLRRVREALEVDAVPAREALLIVLCGLPGTGKTTLAQRLAHRLPAAIVQTDHIRKVLFPEPDYGPGETRWVHLMARILVRLLLREGKTVIHDATNLRREHRQEVYSIAEKERAPVAVLVLEAPEEITRWRLSRAPRGHSDASWEVYERMRREWEPVRERPHLVVSSDEVHEALEHVERAGRGEPQPRRPA